MEQIGRLRWVGALLFRKCTYLIQHELIVEQDGLVPRSQQAVVDAATGLVHYCPCSTTGLLHTAVIGQQVWHGQQL